MNEPGFGHNKGPEQTAIERATELLPRINAWLKDHPTITTAEVAGQAQELIVQAIKLETKLDTDMRAERAPYDAMVGAIRKKFRDFETLTDSRKRALRQRLTPYLQAEDDRLAAEANERRRLAEEAAARAQRATDIAADRGDIESALEAARAIDEADEAVAAADQPVERAQIKSDLVSRASSLVPHWSAKIDDPKKAIRFFAKALVIDSVIVEAMGKVARRMARELKDESKAPPGVTFVRKESAR